MVKRFLIFIMFTMCSMMAMAQSDSLVTEEYAIVRARVYYQGGDLVKAVSVHPNPSVSWKGVNEGKFLEPFKNVVQVMNFMQTMGWKYVNSDVIEYKGDAGNNSSSTLGNTNEFLQILYFKKDVKTKISK